MQSPLLRQVRRSAYIGIGGTGNEIVRNIKRAMLLHGYTLPVAQYLVVDSVQFREKPDLDPLKRLKQGEEYVYIGGFNPNGVLSHLENWPILTQWWGKRDRKNLTVVDEGAGQMRSVGRMSFFYKFPDIHKQLLRMIREMMSASHREEAQLQDFDVAGSRPIVYIIFSLCGGTGSSCFMDMAYVIRHLMSGSEVKPRIVGVALLPDAYVQAINTYPQQQRVRANAYAALMEIERLNDMAIGEVKKPDDKHIWNMQYTTNLRVSSTEQPFDAFYLIDNVNTRGEPHSLEYLYETIGKALFWLSAPPTAALFWERAENNMSTTVAGGASLDASGRRRYSSYSSLGISTVKMNWHNERIYAELEGIIIDSLLNAHPLLPELPSWLASSNILCEELAGDTTGINPFPDGKAMNPVGLFKDADALSDVLFDYETKYQSVLSGLATLPLWQQQQEKYRHTAIKELERIISSSLVERGPVATSMELKDVRRRLQELSSALLEMAQRAQQQKAKMYEQVKQERALLIITQDSPLTNFWNSLKGALAHLFIWRSLRQRAITRELSVKATTCAEQLYQWYREAYIALVCNHILQSILTPTLTFVDEQVRLLTEVGHVSLVEALQTLKEQSASLLNKAVPVTGDSIRPRVSEIELVHNAIATHRLNPRHMQNDMLRIAFKNWPDQYNNALDALQLAIRQVALETLKQISNREHIAQLLATPAASSQLSRLLNGAECLWNFSKERSQDTLVRMESINIVGYGVDDNLHNSAQDVQSSLSSLFSSMTPPPEFVSTDISEEIVFLKTSHGLNASDLLCIPTLHLAYLDMKEIRNAPYLHTDFTEQALMDYRSLADIEMTSQQLVNELGNVANAIEDRRVFLADALRDGIDAYSLALAKRNLPLTESIDVNNEQHPLFDLVDHMRTALDNVSETPDIEQVKVKLVDMESVLHVQGWNRFTPAIGTRFDRSLHTLHKVDNIPQVQQPDRVTAVIHAGYKRLKNGRQQVRVAVVNASN